MLPLARAFLLLVHGWPQGACALIITTTRRRQRSTLLASDYNWAEEETPDVNRTSLVVNVGEDISKFEKQVVLRYARQLESLGVPVGVLQFIRGPPKNDMIMAGEHDTHRILDNENLSNVRLQVSMKLLDARGLDKGDTKYSIVGSGTCYSEDQVIYMDDYSWIGQTTNADECRQRCNDDPLCVGYQQSGEQLGIGGSANCVIYSEMPTTVQQLNDGWDNSVCYAKEAAKGDGMVFLFNGCPRVNGQQVSTNQGHKSYAECAASCDGACYGFEINGCTGDKICSGICWTFDAHPDTLANGNCDASGSQKTYIKDLDAESPAVSICEVYADMAESESKIHGGQEEKAWGSVAQTLYWWKYCRSHEMVEYVWMVESDAVFNGDVSDFIGNYLLEDADLVSSGFRIMGKSWWAYDTFQPALEQGLLTTFANTSTFGSNVAVAAVSEPECGEPDQDGEGVIFQSDHVVRYSANFISMLEDIVARGFVGTSEGFLATLCASNQVGQVKFEGKEPCEMFDFAPLGRRNDSFVAEDWYCWEGDFLHHRHVQVPRASAGDHCEPHRLNKWLHPIHYTGAEGMPICTSNQ